MNNLNKINRALNLMIALVLISIGVVVIKHYWHRGRSAVPPADYAVPTGSKVSLPDIDWEKSRQTLLLVLDTECRYCTASAPFYQQIVRESANNHRVQLIAAFPQEISKGKQYLNDLNVPITEVRQSSLNALGVKGTPTLILINSKAEVLRSWPGKLSSEEEKEVLLKIGSLNASSVLKPARETSLVLFQAQPRSLITKLRRLSTVGSHE